MMDKVRKEANSVEEMQVVIGNVKGRRVLVVDDMIDTGGTLNGGINILMSEGAVEVSAVCMHGIFSGNAFKNLAGKKVIASNSIDWCDREGVPESFTCLDCRPLIDDIITRINNQSSMGSFFHRWP